MRVADLSEGSGAGSGPEPAHAVEDFSQRMLQERLPDVICEPLAAGDDPVEVGSQVTNSLTPGRFGHHRDGLGGERSPDLVGEFFGRCAWNV